MTTQVAIHAEGWVPQVVREFETRDEAIDWMAHVEDVCDDSDLDNGGYVNLPDYHPMASARGMRNAYLYIIGEE